MLFRSSGIIVCTKVAERLQSSVALQVLVIVYAQGLFLSISSSKSSDTLVSHASVAVTPVMPPGSVGDVSARQVVLTVCDPPPIKVMTGCAVSCKLNVWDMPAVFPQLSVATQFL